MPAAATPSLNEQIEAVEARLEKLIRKAETGEHWAEIAKIEADELAPLLKRKMNDRLRAVHARAHGTFVAQPSYFVVMIDHGRKGREAVVDPEITRNGVISRIQSGEYRDILFIHYIVQGSIPVDVTDELIGEAEATREVPDLMKQFDETIGVIRQWVEAA